MCKVEKPIFWNNSLGILRTHETKFYVLWAYKEKEPPPLQFKVFLENNQKEIQDNET